MGTELQTVEAGVLTGSWAQLLTPSAQTVLDRVINDLCRKGYTEVAATGFTPAEIRAVVPIANATPPAPIPAGDRFLRQALAGLASALPSKATDEITGKLKLATYMTMLRGYPEEAFVATIRRCIDELEWFPTIRDLKARLGAYVSPEQRMIDRAKFIVRNPMPDDGPEPEPMTIEELKRLARSGAGRACLNIGLMAGHVSQADYDAAMVAVDIPGEAA